MLSSFTVLRSTQKLLDLDDPDTEWAGANKSINFSALAVSILTTAALVLESVAASRGLMPHSMKLFVLTMQPMTQFLFIELLKYFSTFIVC